MSDTISSASTLASAAAAVGRVPSGLFVVTARHPEGRTTGMLASWVQQASFEPLGVVVALAAGRYVSDWLDDGAAVAVNVLAEGAKPLLAHFARGFEEDEDAFAGLSLLPDVAAAPVLADALAWFGGVVADRLPTDDHVLHYLHVTGGAVLGDARPWRHVRNNAAHY